MRNLVKKLGLLAITAVCLVGVYGVSISNAGTIPYNINNVESFLGDSNYFNGYNAIVTDKTFSGAWQYTAIASEAGNINITEEITTGPATFSTSSLGNWGKWDDVIFGPGQGNIYFSDSDGPYNVTFNPFISGGNQFKLFQLKDDSKQLAYLANKITLSKGTYIIGWNDNSKGTGDSDFDDIIIALRPVPEPTSMLLFGLGLLGLAGLRRRFKN